jgi:acyl-CoA thioesterase YciA
MNQKDLDRKNKQPTLRLTTQPNDANIKGDIFGGWLMSQIDIAGAIAATRIAQGEISTIAVNSLQFINPIFIYDVVSFYTEVIKIGTTSVTIGIEVYAQRERGMCEEDIKIAEATFVYVAIDKPGKKRMIPKQHGL